VLVSLNFFDLALEAVVVKYVWNSYGMFKIALLVSKKSTMVEINPSILSSCGKKTPHSVYYP
jgi:hypothetical protein